MKLLIAIPALNEEESIEGIIEKSLAAGEYIRRHSPVREVEVTVVSDGSTDRTVELASKYRDRIKLIVFPQNRGYGAAIKEAWQQSDAGLLGFLDADGTCDPNFFATLARALEENKADIALGCRLNKHSRMPLLRRVGNWLFAAMLSVLSSTRVRDSASGMRLVRRESLDRLFPLPNGLNFTPAMSARGMLSDALQIVEVDMPYHERAGESKLRVLRDGLAFLRVIVETAFLYHPSRPLGLLAALFLLSASALMAMPVFYYLENRLVEWWMIYRFLVSHLLGTAACLCVCASYLTERIADMTLAEEVGGRRRKWHQRFFRGRWFWLAPAGLALLGGLLVLASFLELLATGATYEHWSRFIVMSFCFSTAIVLAVTRGIDYILTLVEDRLNYLRLKPVPRGEAERGFHAGGEVQEPAGVKRA